MVVDEKELIKTEGELQRTAERELKSSSDDGETLHNLAADQLKDSYDDSQQLTEDQMKLVKQQHSMLDKDEKSSKKEESFFKGVMGKLSSRFGDMKESININNELTPERGSAMTHKDGDAIVEGGKIVMLWSLALFGIGYLKDIWYDNYFAVGPISVAGSFVIFILFWEASKNLRTNESVLDLHSLLCLVALFAETLWVPLAVYIYPSAAVIHAWVILSIFFFISGAVKAHSKAGVSIVMVLLLVATFAAAPRLGYAQTITNDYNREAMRELWTTTKGLAEDGFVGMKDAARCYIYKSGLTGAAEATDPRTDENHPCYAFTMKYVPQAAGASTTEQEDYADTVIEMTLGKILTADVGVNLNLPVTVKLEGAGPLTGTVKCELRKSSEKKGEGITKDADGSVLYTELIKDAFYAKESTLNFLWKAEELQELGAHKIECTLLTGSKAKSRLNTYFMRENMNRESVRNEYPGIFNGRNLPINIIDPGPMSIHLGFNQNKEPFDPLNDKLDLQIQIRDETNKLGPNQGPNRILSFRIKQEDWFNLDCDAFPRAVEGYWVLSEPGLAQLNSQMKNYRDKKAIGYAPQLPCKMIISPDTVFSANDPDIVNKEVNVEFEYEYENIATTGVFSFKKGEYFEYKPPVIDCDSAENQAYYTDGGEITPDRKFLYLINESYNQRLHWIILWGLMLERSSFDQYNPDKANHPYMTYEVNANGQNWSTNIGIGGINDFYYSAYRNEIDMIRISCSTLENMKQTAIKLERHLEQCRNNPPQSSEATRMVRALNMYDSGKCQELNEWDFTKKVVEHCVFLLKDKDLDPPYDDPDWCNCILRNDCGFESLTGINTSDWDLGNG